MRQNNSPLASIRAILRQRLDNSRFAIARRREATPLSTAGRSDRRAGLHRGALRESLLEPEGDARFTLTFCTDAFRLPFAELRIDAELGGLDLVSITDYQHLKKFYIEGGDGVPELPYDFTSPSIYPFAYSPAPCDSGAA